MLWAVETVDLAYSTAENSFQTYGFPRKEWEWVYTKITINKTYENMTIRCLNRKTTAKN